MRSSVATRYQLGFDRHAGVGDGPGEGFDAPGHLRVGEERGLLGGQVARRRTRRTCSRSRQQEAVDGRQDRGNGRARRGVGDEGADRLALVGGERGDVHERADPVMGSGLGDHDAAVGVADEDDRAVELVEDACRGCDVIGQRRRGVLDDAHVVSFGDEQVVDGLPSGAIDEATVDQDDRCLAVHGVLPLR